MLKQLLPNKSSLNYLVICFAVYHFLLNSVGTISADIANNSWNTLLVWFGTPVLLGLSLNEFFRKPVPMPKESRQILFFFLFVITGFFYCIDEAYFLIQYRKLFLFFATFVVIQFIVSQTGNLNLIFVSVLLASTYISIYSLFLVPEEFGGGFSSEEGFRVTGGYINPNGFSNYSISGIIAILFLHKNLAKPYNTIVLFFMPLFILSVVAAASKTGFVSLVVTFGLWYVFCVYSATGRNAAKAFFILLIGSIAFSYLLDFIIDNTYLGKRFNELSDINEYYEKDGRGQLTNTAIDVFMDNPVLGVGLGQFRYYNKRKVYSHSEYLEILTNFGIVGSLIYFPFYFLIWKRLRLISSSHVLKDPVTIYNINFMKVILFTILFRGISVIIIYSFDELIFLGIAGGYSFYILRKLTETVPGYVGLKLS